MKTPISCSLLLILFLNTGCSDDKNGKSNQSNDASSVAAINAAKQDSSKTKDSSKTSNSTTSNATALTLAATSDSPCVADKSWFDGSFEPGKNAQAFKGGSLCAFHQFSWQTFIWLTEQVKTGKVRFDTLYSDSAILPDSKPGNHVLGGVNQAGSNAILVDQNGRAVYTTMMINDIYRNFVIKNELFKKSGMQAVAADLDFPDGAMSLKASWKIIQPGEDTSEMFVMTAPVQLLDVVNGLVTVADDAPQQTMQVALVGFHIAVFVHDHPEAIWATFEQKQNAPAFAQNQSPTEPVSAKDFTFYQGGTLAKDCNANNSGLNAILQLDKATQVMKNVTQACLQFPFGSNDSTPQADSNRKAIQQLNESVHQLMAEGSVWKNYKEIGAVWFSKSNALKPDWNPNVDDSMLIGSTRLSNTTIETFTQNVKSQNECFSCHNTMSLTEVPPGVEVLPGKNISTSHILLKNYIDGNVVKR